LFDERLSTSTGTSSRIWESYFNYWTIKWLSSTLSILFVELYFIYWIINTIG